MSMIFIRLHTICAHTITCVNNHCAFTKVMKELHTQTQKPSTLIANLSGFSRSYYGELLNGHKMTISLPKLRNLCEFGLRLDKARCLEIFRLRLIELNTPLPTEFFWRLAEHASLKAFAHLVGVDRSYIVKIIRGQRVPSYIVMHSIGLLLEFNEEETTQILIMCHKFQRRQRMSQQKRMTH